MKWYVFLVVYVLLYSASAMECYQEYTNNTSPLDTPNCNLQRGSINSTYNTALWTNYENIRDGDWNTYTNTTQATTTVTLIYYMKPVNQTLNGTQWVVKTRNLTTDNIYLNMTLNQTCLDNNPIQVRINAVYTSRATQFYCITKTGTAILLRNLVGAQSTIIYEEAMIWTVNQSYPQYELVTPGNYTFTMPSGINSVMAEVIGAGGSGASLSTASSYRASGGGGGGAYARRNITFFQEGQNYTIQVGISALNTSGQDSYFINYTSLLAKGGQPGNDSSASTPPGGNGGNSTYSVGDVKYSGGQGGYAYVVTSTTAYGGGGGGGAGNISNGNNATTFGGVAQLVGGVPANYNGGRGGNGSNGFAGPSCANASQAGSNYGGGGGGGAKAGTGSCASSNGAGGYFSIILYPTPQAPPADTCTYSGSGNWDILCSDSCTLSTNTFVLGNITFRGTGTVNLRSNITLVGVNRFKFHYPGCTLNTFKGGAIGG